MNRILSLIGVVLMAGCSPAGEPFESYYDNGQLYEKGIYRDGEKCGEWFEGRAVTYNPC